MGDAKRRREYEARIKQIGSDLTKELTEKGKLIEAGFAALASMAIPKNAPAIQMSEMQMAFMAGAEHVWSSMINMLDPEEEPTAADLRRMESIERELDEWRVKLSARINPPKNVGTPKLEFEQQQPHERLGDAPVEAQYHEKLIAIMGALDEFLNDGAKGGARKTGLVVLMFPYGSATSGRVNFMSNGADRKDVVILMKEMIQRFSGQPEMTGKA